MDLVGLVLHSVKREELAVLLCHLSTLGIDSADRKNRAVLSTESRKEHHLRNKYSNQIILILRHISRFNLFILSLMCLHLDFHL